MEPRPFPDAEPPRVPPWLRGLGIMLLVAAAVGLLIFLMRSWRRGGTGLLMAAAIPAMASMPMATKPRSRSAVNQHTLRRGLEEIAANTPRLTPTELFDRLQAYDLELSSVQEMGRLLRELGLQSQVDYVSGRSERRWYRLDGWRTDESL
jgi:hypothetical protein